MFIKIGNMISLILALFALSCCGIMEGHLEEEHFEKRRKCLFAHSVCGRSVLFAHSVCGRNDLFAHSPGYSLSCNYMILCEPAAAAATSAEKILSL